MSRLVIYGIIALSVLGAVTAVIASIYHKGYAAGEASIKAQWEEANRLQRDKESAQADVAAKGLEVERGKQQVVYRTITQSVDKIIDRPVYRNVCLDADGLCVANAGIRGESADSCKPAPAVPPARTTDGRDRGIRLALDYGEHGILSRLRRETSIAYGGG